MKLNAINNSAIKQNRTNNQNNKNQKTPTFKGGTDFLVNAWRFIDSSRGIQFTVEDMLGTNIPRTWKGAMAGYKYTGEINMPALIQEAIREFLTGPTMTAAPIAILALATKMTGKTANTHDENIRNLSYLTSTLKEKENVSKEAFKSNFIQTVVSDMLRQTTQSEPSEGDIQTLINEILNYEKSTQAITEAKAQKLPRAKVKELKKASKEQAEKMQLTYESTIKRVKKDYKDTNFKIAKYSKGKNTKPGATAFENYIDYTLAYVQDYTKKNLSKEGIVNLSEKAINAFRKNWCAKRATIAASMIFLTGIIMSFIPKIYTFFSGDVSPNASGIYKEAQKGGGK